MGPSSQAPFSLATCTQGGVPRSADFVGAPDPTMHSGHTAPGNARIVSFRGTSSSKASTQSTQAMEPNLAPLTGQSSRAPKSPPTCMSIGAPRTGASSSVEPALASQVELVDGPMEKHSDLKQAAAEAREDRGGQNALEQFSEPVKSGMNARVKGKTGSVYSNTAGAWVPAIITSREGKPGSDEERFVVEYEVEGVGTCEKKMKTDSSLFQLDERKISKVEFADGHVEQQRDLKQAAAEVREDRGGQKVLEKCAEPVRVGKPMHARVKGETGVVFSNTAGVWVPAIITSREGKRSSDEERFVVKYEVEGVGTYEKKMKTDSDLFRLDERKISKASPNMQSDAMTPDLRGVSATRSLGKSEVSERATSRSRRSGTNEVAAFDEQAQRAEQAAPARSRPPPVPPPPQHQEAAQHDGAERNGKRLVLNATQHGHADATMEGAVPGGNGSAADVAADVPSRLPPPHLGALPLPASSAASATSSASPSSDARSSAVVGAEASPEAQISRRPTSRRAQRGWGRRSSSGNQSEVVVAARGSPLACSPSGDGTLHDGRGSCQHNLAVDAQLAQAAVASPASSSVRSANIMDDSDAGSHGPGKGGAADRTTWRSGVEKVGAAFRRWPSQRHPAGVGRLGAEEVLEQQVAELRRDLAAAHDRIAELEAQLEKLQRGSSAGERAAPSIFDVGINTDPAAVSSACVPTGAVAPHEFQELVDGDAGCEIKDTADRGITLGQLRKLATFIEQHCSRLGWTSTRDQQALVPHNTNLYDVAHHVIKPATAHRACSYVEFVARQEQPPKWFVSHWWGEPVLLFVACLAQHAVDRKLRPSTSYWVCAYANNQHRLQDDIVADPGKSSFRRAMASAVGTISVVDREATCFKRVWCTYEVWVSLDPMASASTYKYDVYTALDATRAVGFTDGLTETDRDNGALSEWFHVGGAHAYKALREASFPADIVRRAFEVKLHEAAATEETDRRRILNSIAGRGLDLEPLADHKTYESVNQALKWRIGLAAHAVIDRGDVPGVQLDSLEAPQAWAGRAAAAYLPLCGAYTALGRYALARRFGERAVIEAECAKDEEVAEACVTTGQAMYRNANYTEALSFFDRALAIRERSVGRQHPDVAAVLHEKGWCHYKMREHERSLNLYEEALAIRKEALGDKHLAVGQTLNGMGALLRNMGEPARALSLYDEALAVCREVLGDKDPYVGGTLSNIAGVLQDMGEFARALSLYEEAFVVKKGALGKHPGVAATMTNMAILLTEMGERARAMSLYEEALAMRKEVQGDKHPDVGITLNRMAALHQHAGRHARAAECYEGASHVYAQVYGEDHSETAGARANAAAARLQAEGAR